MLHRFLAALALVAAFPLLAAPQMPSRPAPDVAQPEARFLAPKLAPLHSVALPAPQERVAVGADESGRYAIAAVRALEKAQPVFEWHAVPEGYVTKLSAMSVEAAGLRVRLDFERLPGALEVRVAGDDGRIEEITVAPSRTRAWTPWTGGSRQVIELFSRVRPVDGAVRVAALLHFAVSPLEKQLAASCTLSTACSTGDAAIDAAIAERKKSLARITFVEGVQGFACSATLINTEKFPAGYLVTANHCVSTEESAETVTALWFYELAACDVAAANPNQAQTAGGTQLVFTNHNADSSLLLMAQPPPAGASYSAWDAARMTVQGQPVVSLSHPRGDTSRYALGTFDQEYRIVNLNLVQDEYGVNITKGFLEPGSSGSGLFTLSDGTLKLRGVLTGTDESASCSVTPEQAVYGRFDIFYPEIEQFVTAATRAADDAPNRVQDFASVPDGTTPTEAPLTATPIALDNRAIDYPGDVDLYRINVSQLMLVSAWTVGGMDTIGSLLQSDGLHIESSDDQDFGNLNMGISRMLSPGQYFVLVAPWDPKVTGRYGLRLRGDVVGTNYTDLWWNPSESGWGININHQGNIVFATVFTYDTDGTGMWLVMSNGALQPDGSFSGTLYRASGPPFNANPWRPVSVAEVGSMRVAFNGTSAGTLTYNVNGVSVTKNIVRQAFASTTTTCGWTVFNRSLSSNYQDLWWNPDESGWGLNLAHQGDILFATLFTYDAQGKGMWLVMSNGAKQPDDSYSGTLYQTTGPAFNASPWTAIHLNSVGTMRLTFTDGNTGTLTYTVGAVQVQKTIQRQVFAALRAQCD